MYAVNHFESMIGFIIAIVFGVIHTLFAETSGMTHKIPASYSFLLNSIQLNRFADFIAGFLTLGRILTRLDAVEMSASVRPYLLDLKIFHQIHVGFAASGVGPGIDGLLFLIRLEMHPL